MIGAIVGDIIGSYYEFKPYKGEDFPLFPEKSRFTDDTVMTLAVGLGIMQNYQNEEESREEIINNMQELGRKYYRAGYGMRFVQWLQRRSREPYNSFGNGSAMRVSSVAWAYQTLEDVEKFAKISAEVTHNHPEGIKGAQATAAAIFMARQGKSKEEIKDFIQNRYNYNLSRTIAEIRPAYRFDETCQGSVPEAIICFLESNSFEDAVRKAVSLGGDSDTQAAIAGSIAEAYYQGVPEDILKIALTKLDTDLLIILQSWQKWLKEEIAHSTLPFLPYKEEIAHSTLSFLPCKEEIAHSTLPFLPYYDIIE